MVGAELQLWFEHESPFQPQILPEASKLHWFSYWYWLQLIWSDIQPSLTYIPSISLTLTVQVFKYFWHVSWSLMNGSAVSQDLSLHYAGVLLVFQTHAWSKVFLIHYSLRIYDLHDPKGIQP